MNARALSILLATRPIAPSGGRRNLGRPAILTLMLAVVALALGATTALASDFTLRLDPPSPGQPGQPMVLNASGTIPLDEIQYPYWFSLDVVPRSVVSTCPAEAGAGSQLALYAGGQIVVLTQREVPDASGHFSLPVGFTPWAPGTYLICAYTDDGLTTTLAAASATLEVSGRRPLNVSRPRVKRAHGRLVCRPGRWAYDPTSISHRWRVRGGKVRCVVTAKNAAGATTAASPAVSASRALRHRLSQASAAW